MRCVLLRCPTIVVRGEIGIITRAKHDLSRGTRRHLRTGVDPSAVSLLPERLAIHGIVTSQSLFGTYSQLTLRTSITAFRDDSGGTRIIYARSQHRTVVLKGHWTNAVFYPAIANHKLFPPLLVSDKPSRSRIDWSDFGSAVALRHSRLRQLPPWRPTRVSNMLDLENRIVLDCCDVTINDARFLQCRTLASGLKG
jgi:hypothetical protein